MSTHVKRVFQMEAELMWKLILNEEAFVKTLYIQNTRAR